MLAADEGLRVAIVVVLGAKTVGAVVEIGEYLASLALSSVRVGGYANTYRT